MNQSYNLLKHHFQQILHLFFQKISHHPLKKHIQHYHCFLNYQFHIEDLIYRTSFDIKYYNCYYKFVDYFDYLLTGFNAFYKFSLEYHNIMCPLDGYLSDEDCSDNKSDSDNDSESESDNNLEMSDTDTSGYGWNNKKLD